MHVSRHLFLVLSLTILALPTAGTARAAEPPLQQSFEAQLNDRRAQLIDVRHDLHRHPEVSGEERRTAGVVAQRLRAAGLEVRTGLGGHGVVAVLRGGRPGPVVGLRADMDAVYSDDPDPVDYRSVVPGVRHVCGHDVHTTVALAVGESFAPLRELYPGTLVLYFQPAEERAAGARAMIDDGALRDPRPEAFFALHTTPLQVGQIGSKPGWLLAGRDRVRVRLEGSGDLDAAGNRVKRILESLNTVGPEQMRQLVPEDFVAVSGVRDGRESAGEWVVRASISVTTDSLRQRIKETLERRLAEEIAGGVTYRLEYRGREVPGVYNDPELEAASRAALRSVVGDDSVLEIAGVIPAFSEDFGFFQDEAPGVMYWLGVSNAEKGTVGMPHTPTYVADDESIFVGARTLAAVVLDYARRGR